MAHVHLEYYSAAKKNEIMDFAGKWVECENIMLTKGNQTQEDKHHVLLDLRLQAPTLQM